MILAQYTRLGAAAYLPHLDILRVFGRTIRRAGLKIAYSAGFHPHMLLFFTQPLPVGLISECEFCLIDSPETPAAFMERFNNARYPGIEIIKACAAKPGVNPARDFNAAEYEFKLKPGGAEGAAFTGAAVQGFLKKPLFAADKKGEERDISSKIVRAELTPEGAVRAVLLAGNENLRADVAGGALLNAANIPLNGAAGGAGADITRILDITRKIMYNLSGGKLTEAFTYTKY